MAKAVEGLGTTLALLPGGTFHNGWRLPPPSIGNFRTDYVKPREDGTEWPDGKHAARSAIFWRLCGQRRQAPFRP
ncbi:MAG: hypothetical protein CR217_05255 [Beijerinckiaceae bacterium]|nr:MAG: hypothetical protein CR217_05255 [Beijerinckiaceae bacterium]